MTSTEPQRWVIDHNNGEKPPVTIGQIVPLLGSEREFTVQPSEIICEKLAQLSWYRSFAPGSTLNSRVELPISYSFWIIAPIVTTSTFCS